MSEALQALQCCSVLQLAASLQSDDPGLTSVIGVTLGPKVPGGGHQTLGLMSDTWADENL